MKKTLFTILFLFYSCLFFANNGIKSNPEKMTVSSQRDTIYVIEQCYNNKVGFDLEKDMPWIGAILLGLLSVLTNLFINKQLRKSNKENSVLQLSQSKEFLLKQLEFANKSMQLEFNKTVLSGNRQVWINDLRENISKILSNIFVISLKQNITNQEFENLRFLIIKVELMLNKEADNDFILSLNELEKCCLDIIMTNRTFSDLDTYVDSLKHHAQITLKTEWERVKKGE